MSRFEGRRLMSEAPDRRNSPKRLAILIIVAATLGGVAVLAYPPNSPSVVAPKNQEPFVYAHMEFGAAKAAAIAIKEVKKREGWSGNPDWVMVDQEGFTWYITVRRKPRSDKGARCVAVNARSGKVARYSELDASH